VQQYYIDLTVCNDLPCIDRLECLTRVLACFKLLPTLPPSHESVPQLQALLVQGLRDVISANEQPALPTLASTYTPARSRSSSSCSSVPDAASVALDAAAILRGGVRNCYEQMLHVLLRRTLKKLSALTPALDCLAVLSNANDVEVLPEYSIKSLVVSSLHTPSTTDGK
jgi:hypothetical protein